MGMMPMVPVRPAPPTNQGNRWGIISLICGLTSVLMLILLANGQFGGFGSDAGQTVGYILIWMGVSVAALVLGVMGIRAAGRREATNRGVAVAGLIVGIVICAFLALVFVIAAQQGY